MTSQKLATLFHITDNAVQ